MAPAQRHDVPLVTAILDEASKRIQRAGIDQWTPGQWTETRLVPHADAGELFLAWFGTEAAATLTLQWEDEFFWGPQPPDAGYVHALALLDRWIGLGLGRALLTWAGERVRTQGRSLLRLDCMAANPRLRAYYECLGFTFCGESGPERHRAALYERSV